MRRSEVGERFQGSGAENRCGLIGTSGWLPRDFVRFFFADSLYQRIDDD